MSVKQERKLFQLERQVKQLEAQLASKTMEAEVLLKENESLKDSLAMEKAEFVKLKGNQSTAQKKTKRRLGSRLIKD